ncbi:hypothetical protein GJU40_10715 [Bacillus lacus]|uniref:Uncharacterized protein n=1 Tax=Metabacillus lacus TaxID=1983721 RepID=A0A7X2IZF3_9BACI|nr:hypothetical protein [Metabacillus lacus]MRX72618.1 hypothetical protein [Metabacillus lacus]
MAHMKFYLEAVGSRPVSTDYTSPAYISTEGKLAAAAKEMAKKQKLKYIGYDQLQKGYRVYFEKAALLKSSRKNYIYYAEYTE